MADLRALGVTMEVAQVMEALGVPYFVGGSLASSYHGIPRATQDADLVVDLQHWQVPALVRALKPRFYVEEERAREAVDRRSSFNVIHLGTMFKVDLFLLRDDALAREELSRRQRLDLGTGLLEVASAEDTLLEKLAWYRLGAEVSDRQWGDALGILKVQRQSLDLHYLATWAEHLGVTDLLERAFEDAGAGRGDSARGGS